jgi:hypothetical protein
MLASLACNKGAAEESLQEAEGAIADARPDLERYAPKELAELSETLEDARADVEAGHYTRALRAAQELPARIRSARARAERRRDALGAEWDELSPRVATLIEELRAGVSRLGIADGAATATPREARLRAASTELLALVEAWEGAAAAHQKGEVSRAVRTVRDVHARARDLAGALGLATVPQPTGAGDPPSLE